MARPSPHAELERLAEVEAAWRDALSHVIAGEAAEAAVAIEAAGHALALLRPADEVRAQLSEEELVVYAARTERLFALHAQLLETSTRERDQLERELAGTERGRATLHAYAAQHIWVCW